VKQRQFNVEFRKVGLKLGLESRTRTKKTGEQTQSGLDVGSQAGDFRGAMCGRVFKLRQVKVTLEYRQTKNDTETGIKSNTRNHENGTHKFGCSKDRRSGEE